MSVSPAFRPPQVAVRAPGGGAPVPRGPGSASPPIQLPLVPNEGLAPEELHPALWRATQLARPGSSVCPSHHEALDAVLPGGGWPARELTELLLPHAGVGELRLLAPVLATLQSQQRSVMWFDPPAAPCAWALGALGIDVRQLVVVQSRGGQTAAGPVRPAGVGFGTGVGVGFGDRQDQTRPGDRPRGRARAVLPAADILWALEQALKSGHLGAVLAWLPARLPADALRRLQLAAQAHDGPAFLLRDAQMRSKPSAAPLRLLLGSAGPDLLRVAVLKRRGPPLAQPLTLALAQVLSAPALARAQQLAASAPTASAPAAVPMLRRALPL